MPFKEAKYREYLSCYPKARAITDKCDLQVMATLVHHSLEYGRAAHAKLKSDDESTSTEARNYISTIRKLAQRMRSTGETDRALDLESAVPIFEELATELDSNPKKLGEPIGRKLPGSPVYQVYLEEYLASKNGIAPTPSETAHILAALLGGFDKCPDAGIDPGLIAKKFARFRTDNPDLVAEMRRKTKCDSSGKNDLDRLFGRPNPTS